MGNLAAGDFICSVFAYPERSFRLANSDAYEKQTSNQLLSTYSVPGVGGPWQQIRRKINDEIRSQSS